MTTHIDTESDPGAWAETLASASCAIPVTEGLHPIVRLFCQRNGIPLDHETVPAMNAEVLAILAADDGSDHVSAASLSGSNRGPNVSPVNLPAAADQQGGGLLVSAHNHEVTYGE